MGPLVASVFSTSTFPGETGFVYDGQMGPYLLLPGIGVVGYVYGALLFVPLGLVSARVIWRRYRPA